MFYFQPYLGEWSNLTNIFQGGWNHQLDLVNEYQNTTPKVFTQPHCRAHLKTSAFRKSSLQEILSSLNVPYFVAAPLLIQDLQSWKDQGAFSSLQSYFFVKGMYGTNVCPHFWGRNCWSLAVDWHIDFHMAGWSLECSSSWVNLNYSWLDGSSLKHQPFTP